MKRRVPNLNALRVFEVAARRLSFSLAAQELGVTQSAVSRQIKTLEAYVEVPLFRRLTRAVELTQEGEIYALSVRESFAQLDRATRQLRSPSHQLILTVNCLPTLAMHFLVPRLHRFNTAHPEIDIRLVTSLDPVNFDKGDVALAIRIGSLPQAKPPKNTDWVRLEMVTSWSGVRADLLLRDILVPVCERKFLAKYGPFREAPDLCGVPLVHNETGLRSWPSWFKAFGLRFDETQIKASYGHFFLAMYAAGEGLGMALVPQIALPDRAKAGDLVPLNQFLVDTGDAYYLLCREADWASNAVRSFREWLFKERDRARL